MDSLEDTCGNIEVIWIIYQKNTIYLIVYETSFLIRVLGIYIFKYCFVAAVQFLFENWSPQNCVFSCYLRLEIFIIESFSIAGSLPNNQNKTMRKTPHSEQHKQKWWWNKQDYIVLYAWECIYIIIIIMRSVCVYRRFLSVWWWWKWICQIGTGHRDYKANDSVHTL